MKDLLAAIRDGIAQDELESYRMRHAGKAPNFSNQVLRRANPAWYWGIFPFVELGPIDLSWCDLQGAKFLGCDLIGARFVGADLQGADFTGANLEGADFSAANLEGATFGKATLNNAKFVASNLSKAKFIGASMIACDLTGADLQCTIMTGACLNFAQLTGAIFTQASLTGASLDRCLASTVTFTDADFTGAKVTFNSYSEAVLTITVLKDARNLEFAQLITIDWNRSFEPFDISRAQKIGYILMKDRPTT